MTLNIDVRVHGDIRHLESSAAVLAILESVHGDIRHLEISVFVLL